MRRSQLGFGPLASRRWLSVVLTCLFCVGMVSSSLAAADPPGVMTKIVRDLDLQTKMPVEPPKPEEPRWPNIRWHIPGNIAQWILWGALALGLAFAIYALRDTIPIISKRKKLKPRATATILPNADSVERMTEAGDDADDLARRGLFAEAMHTLLLRSVSELRRRLETTIADSLTSREILQRLTMSDAGRHAFADLIARVERVHFGARAAVAADYDACRASFAALLAAMHRPAAV